MPIRTSAAPNLFSIHNLPHKLWRRLPPAFRRRSLARVTGWLAPKPSRQAVPQAKGIVIAGELSRASGMGETARLMVAAAQRMGMPVWTIDLPPPLDSRSENAPAGSAIRIEVLPPDGTPLVLHVNAPMLPLALLRLPATIARNRPIIGYWAWEMSEIPREWHPALACVSEIWVPSRFTAAALEPLLPGRVHVVPPAMALVPPVASSLGRAAFNLPHEAVVVLVSFNLASSFARKNPFAAIAAFHAAFGDRTDRILLLKVGNPEHAPADFAWLERMTQAPNIRLDTRTLSPVDRHALTACADIVLSLHRGEGFGLVLAEAMLLGKPVIATGWSGNVDFMDSTNAALVSYRLVPARDDRLVYQGLWAEPDVTEAAALLRMLADSAALRQELGERARISVSERMDGRELPAALTALA